MTMQHGEHAMKELIGKLEAQKSQSGRPSAWNNAINACIAIIKQHFGGEV